MLLSSAARVRGLFPYTVLFNMPHRKKSGGERSGDLGGHRPFETTRSGKKGSIEPCLFWRCEFFCMNATGGAAERQVRQTRDASPSAFSVNCLHADGGHFQHFI